MSQKVYLAVLLSAFLVVPAAAEPRRGDFDVHDLSLWITDNATPMANARAGFPSPFPITVQSARGQRSSVATPQPGPVGLLTFYGRPSDELDVELRVKDGGFLGHWPPGDSAPKRLRWPSGAGNTLVARLEHESALLWVDDEHWFARARKGDALFVHRGARAERFLAYDAEAKLASPIRLQGGPDRYTIANVSDAMLYDVVIARLTPDGIRVAWLDELPASDAKQTAAAAPAGPAATSADQAKRAAGLFGSGKKLAADGADAPNAQAAPDKPADGKPVDDAPAKKLFGLAVPKSASPGTEEKPAAKHPAAGLFGIEQLPHSPAIGNNAGPLPGGRQVVLSDPLPAGSDAAKASTSAELAGRLSRAGLLAAEIDVFLAEYSSLLFESKNLVVACRLSPAAMDANVSLSVFPVPQKVVRVPLLLVRNVDPELPSQINRLIAQMGDADFLLREEAERQLTELGPLAFEFLKQAINHEDMEIVIRAERILLNQGEQAAGRQGASDAPPAAAARPPAVQAPALVRGLLRLFGN